MRLHGSRQEQGALHIQIFNPILHHRQAQRDHPRHLDRATETDFPIPLREMQVPDAELGPRHMHGQESLGSPGQVLDVAVATVLRSSGDGPRAFLADLVLQIARGGTRVDVLRLRGLRDDALQLRGRDELGLAAVPLGQDLGAGGAAQDTRVNEAGEADVREVARGAEDAFEVPDGFRAVDRINRGLIHWLQDDGQSPK